MIALKKYKDDTEYCNLFHCNIVYTYKEHFLELQFQKILGYSGRRGEDCSWRIEKVRLRKEKEMINKSNKRKWMRKLSITIITAVYVFGVTGCSKAEYEAANNDQKAVVDSLEDTLAASQSPTQEATTEPTTPEETTQLPTQEGTTEPTDPAEATEPDSSEASGQTDLTQLIGYLGLSKEDLISKLGDTYNQVDEGGLEFTEPGIRVWFDDKGNVNQVYTNNSGIDFNGAEVGDSIEDFIKIFGNPVSESDANIVFKIESNYLSVFYDTNTQKVFAVYVLNEELGASMEAND